MKKKWMLTAIISIIILLVGIFGLMKWNEYRKTEVIEDVETTLCKVKIDEITKVELYEGQALVFTKKGETWLDPEEKELEYEQEKIQQMVSDIADMVSFQTISNIQDQTVYGITENSKLINVYDKNNNIQTFRIGSNVSGQDAVYIWSDSDEVIYLVNYTELAGVFWNREDIVVKDMAVPPLEEIQQVVISEGEKKFKFSKNSKIGEPDHETWLLEEGFKTEHEVNTLLVEEILIGLESLSRDKFVTTDISNLEKYGLDKPNLTIEINEKYTVKFGQTDGDYTYFKYSGDPAIYKMLTEKLKGFKGIDAFNLIRKQVYVPHVEEMTSIIFEQNGKVTEWLFKLPELEETVVDREEEPKKVLLEGESQVGEITFSQEETQGLLDLLANINYYKPLVNPEVEEKQERAAEISITYNLVDGTHHTFEFIPYDPSYSILRYKGHVEFSVDKKSLVTFLNDFKSIIGSKEKEISK
ncbi:MAG: DUF4340 domain-containing protein [Cellulosilyticaceae bacterium]